MAKKTAVKTRNPQDSTRRNVRASNARYAVLKKRLDVLEQQMRLVFRFLVDELGVNLD